MIQSFIPYNYDIFVGMDVDKKSIAATFQDREYLLKSVSMPHSADHMLNYVRNHFPGKKVAFAYEAGPTGYGLYDRLVAEGYPCIVASASMIPKAPGHHVKTNRIDSVRISEALRAGQLRSIHVPSQPYRQLRHLVHLRDTWLRQVTATKCRIKSLLLLEGIPFPEGSTWSRSVIRRLMSIPCNDAVRFKLDSLLFSLTFSQKNVFQTMKEIRRFCTVDTELQKCIELLRTIPGMGYIVSSHVLSRIGDWRQITNVRQIAAFLGLVPREQSTGDRVIRGSITKAGNGKTRSKLIQGAWGAIRIDPELREFYRRICQRHPKHAAAKKAITAVAHKMTKRIYAVLHQQRPYVIRPVKSAALTEEETALEQGTTRKLPEQEDCVSS